MDIVIKKKQENTIDLKVTKFSDLNKIIIPFFINSPILGVKSLYFKYRYLVSEMVKKEEYKLEEGAIKIREIQRGNE